ncbi:putative inositol monophosphatase 3 [Anthonomus grandis grandis]|uniref:putative inositol monophosphatase 3 n=1 Tax=Anthonomus grandis grandis TaxID=2921223 RepID=UPI002164FD76|nr:putative inositol monophosphatase 3 [Anthonomus grandis grandis]
MVFGGSIRLNKRGYFLIALIILIFLCFHFGKHPSQEYDNEISFKELLETAIQAAEAGGKLVVSTRDHIEIKSKGKTKEGMDDSVTTADFLSHCVMEHIIKDAFPHVRFISEETDVPCEKGLIYEMPSKPNLNIEDKFAKLGDVTIWIDPLDATHEYTEKLYQYVTTMVCVAIKGQPIIGVIHNPFFKTTSWAVVKLGLSPDLKKNIKSQSKTNTKVIISRSHSGTIKEVLEKNFKNLEVVIAAGAGYKSLQVANNSVDAYLHITAIKKWDICAGNAILNALGGKMTTKYGQVITYFNNTDVVNKDGVIATLRYHEMFVNML